MTELTFTKYQTKGADYHYQEVNQYNWRKFQAHTLARFHNIVQRLQINLNSIPASPKILDVGCGDGVLLHMISDQFSDLNGKLFGIDPVDEALNIARAKIPSANFSNQSAYKTNFTANTFDIIVSSDVIEHVSHPDKMLKEIQRVAKKDALILLSTPIRITENPKDTMHAHEFFVEEYQKLLNAYFNTVVIEETHDLHFVLSSQRSYNLLLTHLQIFKYWYNLLAIFGRNPYQKSRENRHQIFSNMIAICKNK